MRNRSAASAAAMVVLALVAAACSRDESITSSTSDVTQSTSQSSALASSTSTSTSTATTESPTTTVPATTTTVAPTTTSTATTTIAPTTTIVPTTTIAPTTTTTVPPAGCGVLAALPPGIIETAAKLIDVDADGVADTVRSYAVNAAPSAGDWHLRVELAAGGGVDIALAFDPAPAGVTVLGGYYVGSNVDPGPEGARPAIFATVGAGASASIIDLYRLVGCSLLPMTGSGFPVGGGVVHTEHLRCEGVAGTSLLVYVTTEYDDGAAIHEIVQTPYTRTDNSLVLYNPAVITMSPTLPAHDLIDNCGVDSP